MMKQSGKNKLVINEEFILIKININRVGIFPLNMSLNFRYLPAIPVRQNILALTSV